MRGLKSAIGALAAYGPVYTVLQTVALRRRPLVILCYHTLSADQDGPEAWTSLRASDFRKQLSIIQRSHRIVSLEEALTSPLSSEPRAVLTFDDGDIGLYRHLLPIVKDLKIPVTLYIATSQIESGKAYWFDRLMNGLSGCAATAVSVAGKTWDIPAQTGAARWPVTSAILEHLKTCNTAARDSLADSLLSQISEADPLGEALGPMSIEQLCDMAQTPGIHIGAHSHGHELLDQLSVPEAIQSANQSRDLLEQWTGQTIRDFAYPNGNHSPALEKALGREGFRSSTVLDNMRVAPGTSALALSRLAVGRYETAMRFRLRLLGV